MVSGNVGHHLHINHEPLLQIVKIILIYAWMKVANIVRNPFGLDEHYDINLEEMLDHNIWNASLSIKHLDQPLYL